MVGGVISDIYHAEDRNTPMALFSGAALFGTGLGPLLSSVIAYHTSWRWIFYSHAIVSGAFVVIMYILLKETRGSILLSRKARALNTYYGRLEEAGYYGVLMPGETQTVRRIRWKVKSDEERESLVKMISISCYRPFRKSRLGSMFLALQLTHPCQIFSSLNQSFFSSPSGFLSAGLSSTYSLAPSHWFSKQTMALISSRLGLYLQVSLIAPLRRGKTRNNVCAAMSVGSILSTFLSIYQERIAVRFGKLSSTPEGRLYFACIESILMPAGLFWFGWTSFTSIPWIVPTLAVGCATMGIFSIYLAVFNYLADTYHRYASSALAAQSCCKMAPQVLVLEVSLTDACSRSKSSWWSFPLGHQCVVQQPGISCCVQSAGSNCRFSLAAFF